MHVSHGGSLHARHAVVHARQAFWHSSAHVLGQCLEVLYGGKLCVGPPVQDGFFYDIFVGSMCVRSTRCRQLSGRTDMDWLHRSITEKHYGEIEAQAKEIAKHRQPFERVVLTKEEALELFEVCSLAARLAFFAAA